MLASVLPGIRHARTPLITGALYILLIVVSVGPNRLIPDPDGNEIERRLARLAELLGSGPTIAALGLAAILVGGLIPGPQRLMRHLAQWRSPEYDALFDWLIRNTEAVAGRLTWGHVLDNPAAPRYLVAWATDASEHDLIDLATDSNHTLDPALEDRAEVTNQRDSFMDSAIPGDTVREMLTSAVEREMPQLAVLLQIERETIWNETDRLHSEADLRCAIAPPLTMIVLAFAYLDTSWWLLGLALPAAFFWQGVTSRRDAQLKVRTALAHEVIRSPSIEFAREFRSAARVEMPHPPEPPSAPLDLGLLAQVREKWRLRKMRSRHPQSR